MPEGDRGAWPFPHQAVLAGALAVLTVVLLTAMGGDPRRPTGTAQGVIEASVGPIPPSALPTEALPSPLAGVADAASVADTGAPVPVPPAGSSVPATSAAPGPGTPVASVAATPQTPTETPAAQAATSLGPPTMAPPASTSTTLMTSTTSATTTTTTTVAVAAAGPVRTPGVESEVIPLTNRDRAAQGLSALSRHSCLDSAASRFAEQLAGSGLLAHNPGAGSAVTGCRPGEAWGDNVGTATPCSASLLEEKWMASASHRKNILTPAFRYIGVGAWTDAAGACWVQVLFSS